MVKLDGYEAFGGDHWELGALRNVLDYQGVRMPHTGQAPSEALLLGICGGIVSGYFIFQYQGYPPMFNFLTVNSFDPLQNVIDRLGIETKQLRSGSADKARQNLIQALLAGKAPLVWADASSLGYGDWEWSEDNWFVVPLLVIAYDEDSEVAQCVDRAELPLEIPTATLDTARARIKKERQRLMTVEGLAAERLPEATRTAINQCIEFAVGEAPRKPMRGKFGLAAFTRWADALADERSKNGWKKQFANGSDRFSLLTWFYHYTHYMGTGGYGARGRYADFLDEAAAILSQPDLQDAATAFRVAQQGWATLFDALFSEEFPSLHQARQWIDERERLFRQGGVASLPERKAINAQLEQLRVAAEEALAFSEAEERAWREMMREQVLSLADQEAVAFETLQAVLV